MEPSWTGPGSCLPRLQQQQRRIVRETSKSCLPLAKRHTSCERKPAADVEHHTGISAAGGGGGDSLLLGAKEGGGTDMSAAFRGRHLLLCSVHHVPHDCTPWGTLAAARMRASSLLFMNHVSRSGHKPKSRLP